MAPPVRRTAGSGCRRVPIAPPVRRHGAGSGEPEACRGGAACLAHDAGSGVPGREGASRISRPGVRRRPTPLVPAEHRSGAALRMPSLRCRRSARVLTRVGERGACPVPFGRRWRSPALPAQRARRLLVPRRTRTRVLLACAATAGLLVGCGNAPDTKAPDIQTLPSPIAVPLPSPSTTTTTPPAPTGKPKPASAQPGRRSVQPGNAGAVPVVGAGPGFRAHRRRRVQRRGARHEEVGPLRQRRRLRQRPAPLRARSASRRAAWRSPRPARRPGGMADSFGQTYGRWEFRARTDHGRGFGSAILLWPDSEKLIDGEIDIAEVPAEHATRRTSCCTSGRGRRHDRRRQHAGRLLASGTPSPSTGCPTASPGTSTARARFTVTDSSASRTPRCTWRSSSTRAR